ncbi:MAG: winged helix-turn-helix transcriptional regulator [Gemmatimonadaceae bacterium]|nr:winged helix-turn-helix transcriptional regulator [Gemmatimonadaceae bacterium]NUQ92793.1 winged helix-turn-helix transcriptional regulator [Gemmatimonadaceae bacterium]NUR18982.1 winged helix-turn-helix transcriptional regulator [Gemmatimonadaceae bacterium]
MRPPAKRQSALRNPLNAFLGTEGTVRVLRILAKEDAPIGAGELARRAQLTPVATRRGLAALVDAGLVEVHGRPGTASYALRGSHPLVPALRALFDAEVRRAESLFAKIGDCVRKLKPPPMAVWIEGPVATGSDEPGEPLVLRVVAPAPLLAQIQRQLRETTRSLEQSHDVTIEVAGATPADFAGSRASKAWDERLRTAHGLAGLPPSAYLRKTATPELGNVARRIRSHLDLDREGRAIAHAIAQRVQKDPTLITRAKEFIGRRLPEASGRERHELEEWRHLLDTASPARIRRLLIDPGERATRLRQTLPFLGVLTTQERERMLADAAGMSESEGEP